MSENLMNDVISTLNEHAEAVAPLVQKAAQLEADIKSNRYNMQTINSELYPALHSAHRQIEAAQDEAKKAVSALVEAHVADLERQDALNAEDLTDDCKLLTAGITLNKRDLTALLDKNAGNRTMTQVILRYAREHEIDMGAMYIGNEEKIRAARGVTGAVGLYVDHWMDKPNAKEMIAKMFGA